MSRFTLVKPSSLLKGKVEKALNHVEAKIGASLFPGTLEHIEEGLSQYLFSVNFSRPTAADINISRIANHVRNHLNTKQVYTKAEFVKYVVDNQDDLITGGSKKTTPSSRKSTSSSQKRSSSKTHGNSVKSRSRSLSRSRSRSRSRSFSQMRTPTPPFTLEHPDVLSKKKIGKAIDRVDAHYRRLFPNTLFHIETAFYDYLGTVNESNITDLDNDIYQLTLDIRDLNRVPKNNNTRIANKEELVAFLVDNVPYLIHGGKRRQRF